MDNFLKKLIEIKSFHPNFKELIKCKELIKNELLKLNIPDSKMYDIKDNLIYVINNSLKKEFETIGILLHYDVLSFKQKDCYKLSENNEYYFGVGVTSAKGAISAIISALKEEEITKDKKIRIVFTKDETIGSKEGAIFLTDNKRYLIESDYYWLPDCTDKFISIGCYNIIVCKIKVNSKGGHPAYNKITENINLKTAKMIINLKNEFDILISKYHKKEILINFISTEIKNKENIIPDSGELVVEIRLTPKKNFEILKNEIHNIFERAGIKNVKLVEYPGFYIKNKNNTLINIIKKQGFGLNTQIEYSNHDGSYIGYKLNGSVIGFLPGGENLHRYNEKVKKENINKIKKIFKNIIN